MDFFSSLTDLLSLCFDNWEMIAGHLDLLGLINITEISSDAQKAARLIFKRRYSSHTFGLNWHTEHTGLKSVPIQQSMQLLKYFGHLIMKLDINLAPDSTANIDIDIGMVLSNVNTFCTRNCHRLQLGEYLPFLITEPLKHVEELNIHTGDYSLADFNAMFPNIRTLEISSKEACIYLKQRMPKLIKLCINNSIYNDGNDGIQDADILEAIALNPQIERLEISNGCGFEITRNNGSELELMMEWDARELLFQLIQPEQYEKLDLIYAHEIDKFDEFIVKFVNLKYLIMDSLHEELFDVIDSLPKLQNLKICFEKSDYDKDDFEEIVSVLSSSTEVHEKLSVFTVYFEDEKDRRKFQTVVEPSVNGNIWKMSVIDSSDGPYGYQYSFIVNSMKSD